MNPTEFHWTITVAVLITSISILRAQILHDVSARRLKITPKDCTSLKYPGTVGICMFNLECKEKFGTVIGACVDRFLFGACCHLSFESVEQNVTVVETISSTTQLDTESITSDNRNTIYPDQLTIDNFFPTTIQSVELFHPNNGASSINSNPSTSDIETMGSLHFPHTSSTSGVLSTPPPSSDTPTLFPVPLETIPNGPLDYTDSSSGINNHFHHSNSRFPLPLDTTTLKPSSFKTNYEEMTEEPPRLTTFMYVDGTLSDFAGGVTNAFESAMNVPSESERTTTVAPPPALIDNSGTESLWTIVHQLIPLPSSPYPSPQPIELQLNSDELYHVLSGVEPAGLIIENKIPIIPPSKVNPLSNIWKFTTTSSVSDTGRPTTPVQPRPTNRPWASSTYQIHTFRYPNLEVTTPYPGSGLVTWGAVLENGIHDRSSTTITPLIRTTTTTTMKPTVRTTVTTSKPVAEVTMSTVATTTTTSTEKTTSTSEPTTTTITTTKKKPIPTEKLNNIKQVTTQKPKPLKMEPQPAILQSDFDSNIDDFVNQVVQNLAGSLDNLDLDEVILHPPVPSVPTKEETPPTLHPLHVLSDPLFPPFPVIGQVPLIKPGKTGLGSTKIPPLKKVTTTTTTTTTPRPLDYRKDCGVRSLNKQGRIVGGAASKFGKWPWQALVREATWLGLFSKNKCGGVLISPKYVLSAAHCQPGFLATLTVVLGDFDISSENEGGATTKSSSSVTKNVRRVIVHRDYNAQTFENDIALLELETPVEYQPHIVPICMPNDNEVSVGQQAFVTGWGRLKYGGGVPNTLHEVDVPILNNTDCQNMFLKSGHIKAIRDSFICAGYANGLKDSCEGDSGGPLAIMRSSGQWMLAGTVSHGIKCAYPNLPGVYMRMTYYKPWIKRVTGIIT